MRQQNLDYQNLPLVIDQFEEITGMPLGFEMSYDGMDFSIMASKIDTDKPDASYFKIPEGYEVKSLQEFIDVVEEQYGGDKKVFGL